MIARQIFHHNKMYKELIIAWLTDWKVIICGGGRDYYNWIKNTILRLPGHQSNTQPTIYLSTISSEDAKNTNNFQKFKKLFVAFESEWIVFFITSLGYQHKSQK